MLTKKCLNLMPKNYSPINPLNGKFIFINEGIPSVEASIKQNGEDLNMITSTTTYSISVLCNDVNYTSRVSKVFLPVKNVHI